MLKQLAFAAVFAFTLGLFAYNLTHFIKIAALGRPADLKESWGQRIQSLMTFFFGQRKVAEERRSYHHLLIYWGFLILSIASLEMLLQESLRLTAEPTLTAPNASAPGPPIASVPAPAVRVNGTSTYAPGTPSSRP